MKRTKLILKCRNCGATHQITPPTRKLKRTDNIELDCYRCNFKNNYRFSYKLKKRKK